MKKIIKNPKSKISNLKLYVLFLGLVFAIFLSLGFAKTAKAAWCKCKCVGAGGAISNPGFFVDKCSKCTNNVCSTKYNNMCGAGGTCCSRGSCSSGGTSPSPTSTPDTFTIPNITLYSSNSYCAGDNKRNNPMNWTKMPEIPAKFQCYFKYYKLYKKVGKTNYEIYSTTDRSSINYTQTDQSSTEKQCYWVKAFYQQCAWGGCNNYTKISNQVCFNPIDCGEPEDPLGPFSITKIDEVCTSGVCDRQDNTIYWSASANATKYHVYRWRPSLDNWGDPLIETTSTHFTESPCGHKKDYVYLVVAYNTNGTVDSQMWSDGLDCSCPVLPSAPSLGSSCACVSIPNIQEDGITVNAKGGTIIQLWRRSTWQDKYYALTPYKTGWGYAKYTYQHEHNTAITYCARACNTVGCSGDCTKGTGKYHTGPICNCPPPPLPGSFSCSIFSECNGGNHQDNTVIWTKSAYATKYDLWRHDCSSWTQIGWFDANNRSYLDRYCLNCEYRYDIYATNTTGQTMIQCKSPVLDCITKKTFKGGFIAKEFDVSTGSDIDLTIEYDSSIINNPPPGFTDLLRPEWFEKP